MKPKKKEKPAVEPCIGCGAFHRGPCPRIQSIEYNADGSVKQVNYFRRYKANEHTTSNR